jgi:hypothetical protein
MEDRALERGGLNRERTCRGCHLRGQGRLQMEILVRCQFCCAFCVRTVMLTPFTDPLHLHAHPRIALHSSAVTPPPPNVSPDRHRQLLPRYSRLLPRLLYPQLDPSQLYRRTTRQYFPYQLYLRRDSDSFLL